jgi:hypothetical protein
MATTMAGTKREAQVFAKKKRKLGYTVTISSRRSSFGWTISYNKYKKGR